MVRGGVEVVKRTFLLSVAVGAGDDVVEGEGGGEGSWRGQLYWERANGGAWALPW